MAAAASAIPGMLTGLAALATAAQATTLAGVQIVQGPPTLTPAGVYEALVIGADWDPAEAVAASSELEPYSNFAQVETIEVPCALMVKSGDPATSGPTVRAFALLAEVKALLLADPTLAGAVGYAADVGGGGPAEETSLAQLTSISLRQTVSGGARTVITFTVGAAALLPD